MDVVLIPAYKPDEELIKLVNEIYSEKLSILIVDDGSGKEYENIFERIADKAVIIHSPCNEGKGNALKRGMNAIKENYPECEYFITADSDGQHKVADILRVREKLRDGGQFVLTTRQFRKDTPARSMFGNLLSRWIYTIITGHYLSDNQSGLRGFHSDNIEWLLKVPGSKYDYEINVIFYADKQHIKIDTVSIEALYIDGNKSSHFSPVADTFRIYRRLFTSARASIMSSVITLLVMIALTIVYGYDYCLVTIPTLGACVIVFGQIFNRIIFRNICYKDSMRAFLCTVGRFLLYTFICFFIGKVIPQIPMAVVFVLSVLIIIPIKYNLHKLLKK